MRVQPDAELHALNDRYRCNSVGRLGRAGFLIGDLSSRHPPSRQADHSGEDRPLWRSFAFRMAVLLVAGAVAGCQSGAQDVLDPGAIAAGEKPATASPATGGTVGSGPVRIAVLLPSGATGTAAELARDVRDGATMAADDLGSDVLTVVFEDQSAAGKPKEAAVKAMGEGVAAVVGPFESGPATEVATLKGGKLTPIFLLANGVQGSSSIYSVPLQPGTSAAAGARAAAKEGAHTFVLITAAGNSAAATENAVDFAVADHGARIVAKARFGSDQASVVKAVGTVFDVVEAPDAIVIAGGYSDPAAIVRAVRSRNAKAKIIANSSWVSAGQLDPELEGVLIADVDRSELEPVATRFRSRFGHEFNALAAYSYDVIALSSGIARATGGDGFVRTIIEDRKGFRGSTGIFRFRSDGSSERLLALYRIEKGKLTKVQSPPSVF
jgi:ABC-type branched-subunit amino acid transport system substrate-binding protein